MSISASRRPTQRGFTLLEIMVTVALVGLCILPMLETRQKASDLAYKSGHMMRALAYGQRILTDRMLLSQRVKDETGLVEDDPVYEYQLTVEVYDLSTGRVVEEKDDASTFSTSTQFSTTSKFTNGQAPADSGPQTDDPEKDKAHQVRRVKVTISWPSLEGDQPEHLVLEGFLPLTDDQLDQQDPNNPNNPNNASGTSGSNAGNGSGGGSGGANASPTTGVK
jgi:prepilin-type N-terminal cleavage/methylation domain-containing protein